MCGFLWLQLHLPRRVEMRGLRLQEVPQPERRRPATDAIQPGPADPMGRRLGGAEEPRLRPLRPPLRAGDLGGLGDVPLPHEQPPDPGLAGRPHRARYEDQLPNHDRDHRFHSIRGRGSSKRGRMMGPSHLSLIFSHPSIDPPLAFAFVGSFTPITNLCRSRPPRLRVLHQKGAEGDDEADAEPE